MTEQCSELQVLTRSTTGADAAQFEFPGNLGPNQFIRIENIQHIWWAPDVGNTLYLDYPQLVGGYIYAWKSVITNTYDRMVIPGPIDLPRAKNLRFTDTLTGAGNRMIFTVLYRIITSDEPSDYPVSYAPEYEKPVTLLKSPLAFLRGYGI